jgi:uncharacterized protein (UPF0548 family)
MWSLRTPSLSDLSAYRTAKEKEAFSYHPPGVTAGGDTIAGFDRDRYRVVLGQGDDVFRAACNALRQWRQFPRPWTIIHPASAPLQAGTTVALVMRVFGLWWWNAARIVYTIDQTEPTGRFGFAYGTLLDHVERGEERFTVEIDDQGTVFYEILAISRPRLFVARLSYPIVRRLQRKFVRDSQAAMIEAVQ